MKKIVLTIVLALVLSPLHSCKKEDNEESPEKNYRLKELKNIFIEENDIHGNHIVFHYDNQDRLLKIEYFDSENATDWELYGKLEITYNAQTTTMIYYTFENSQWSEFYTKTLSYSSTGLTNFKVTNPSSETYYEANYQYTNELLSSYTKTYFYPSSSTTTTTYTYTNGVVSEENIEPDSDYLWKSEFLYDNDQIKTRLNWHFDEIWEQQYKWEYVFTNDLVKSITFFWFNLSAQWIEEDIIRFDYDENNTIQSISEGDIDPEIYSFISEEGKSNMEDFILPEEEMYFFPTYLSFARSFGTPLIVTGKSTDTPQYNLQSKTNIFK